MSKSYDMNFTPVPYLHDLVVTELQETILLDPGKECRIELANDQAITVCLDDGRAEINFGAELPIGYP
jgi:hypothetical protein